VQNQPAPPKRSGTGHGRLAERSSNTAEGAGHPAVTTKGTFLQRGWQGYFWVRPFCTAAPRRQAVPAVKLCSTEQEGTVTRWQCSIQGMAAPSGCRAHCWLSHQAAPLRGSLHRKRASNVSRKHRAARSRVPCPRELNVGWAAPNSGSNNLHPDMENRPFLSLPPRGGPSPQTASSHSFLPAAPCHQARTARQHLLFVLARLSVCAGPRTDLPFTARASHVFPGTVHYKHAPVNAQFWHGTTHGSAFHPVLVSNTEAARSLAPAEAVEAGKKQSLQLNNTSNSAARWVGPCSHVKQPLGARLLRAQPIPLLSRYCRNSSQAKHPERFASPNDFQPARSSLREAPVEKASQMGRVAIKPSPPPGQMEMV